MEEIDRLGNGGAEHRRQANEWGRSTTGRALAAPDERLEVARKVPPSRARAAGSSGRGRRVLSPCAGAVETGKYRRLYQEGSPPGPDISDLGVRYLFRRNLTSPLLVRGPHYTHVYWLHAVYCQTLRAS